ncbi:Glucokinase [bioreactor metagenome]|uniref:Glucokinase n=1 Tax=bioreactor metagenome TaxID=1076179 RepID=A0A644VRX1_9ZZZZ
MNYRIGVDVGGTGIKAGVLDGDNRIIAKISVPTGAFRSYKEVAKDMAGAAGEAARKAGIPLASFPCMGFGMPGSLNPRTGRLAFSGNLGWRDVPIREELEKYIPVPVYIGNDANCAVIGEVVAGAAGTMKNVVMLTLGTGVGGGVIIDGKLLRGSDGMGAELGHMLLVLGGEPCTCGASGCVEAYASAPALIRQTKEAMAKHPESMMNPHAVRKGKVSARTAFDCAKQGDIAALEVVDRYAEYLSAAIGSLITVFRPEAVLIGGGLSNEKEYLLDRLNRRAAVYAFGSDVVPVPPIIKATLGNDAGIIGAAYLDTM